MTNHSKIILAGHQIHSTINAVPKIKFKDEGEVFNTNSKRNTLDMAQFQRSKLNTNIRSKFESNGSEAKEIKQIAQPKKKIVDLDQILLKVIFLVHHFLLTLSGLCFFRPKLMSYKQKEILNWKL